MNLCIFQAGIIEEMLEDTMEGFEDQDELEDEAQEEVDKILFDLTAGENLFTFFFAYTLSQFYTYSCY